MRLLVACPKCKRQYNATGKKPGSRFRCRCGAVVKVQRPKGQDAAVVRCSSCGAPREAGGSRCHFCGADFTLHDRDLDTVCPKCLTRISDRARFCHHCGLELSPEGVAGEDTELTCPACGGSRRLTDRPIGEVHVLECGRCAGLWLGNKTFRKLTDRASSDAPDLDRLLESSHARTARRPHVDGQAEDSWRYRKCPACGNMMYRRNYGRRSGVIIDICKEHGVWFDADELPRILTWIRSGGLAKAKEDQAEQAAREERVKRAAGPPVMGAGLGEPDGCWGGRPFGGFLDEIVEWLFRL